MRVFDLRNRPVDVVGPHWRLCPLSGRCAFGMVDGDLWVTRDPDLQRGWYKASPATARHWANAKREKLR